MNLVLAAALGLLGRWWEPLYLLAGAQAVLGCFNLLPILPLDGGRMLWLALCLGDGPVSGGPGDPGRQPWRRRAC